MTASISGLPPLLPRKLAYTFDEGRTLISVGKSVWTKLITSGEIRPVEGHNIVSHAELERYIKRRTKRRDFRRGQQAQKQSQELSNERNIDR